MGDKLGTCAVGGVVLWQYGNSAIIQIPRIQTAHSHSVLDTKFIKILNYSVVFKSLLTQWVGVLWSTVVGQEGNKAVRQSGSDRALDPTDSRMTPSSFMT
jgi:hypothetical protein